MDIDKKFFSDKYIHNISTTTAYIYFTLLQNSYKKNGKRVCEQRSIKWIELITRKSNSQVCEALNRLQYLGLITIIHNYRPLSESKSATRLRTKKGSDTPAYDKNTYYINKL
jgi:hypothetical protein